MSNTRFIHDKYTWKKILKDNDLKDVYIQYEYVNSMAEHFNSRPVLVNYSTKDYGFVYALLIMDIANDTKFKNLISRDVYFDAESPYGYGGPFFYGSMDKFDTAADSFRNELRHLMRNEGIISQFIRFYPLNFFENLSTIIVDKYATYKNTIFLDLNDEETVINNLDSQYRRKIRKAREANIKITHDRGENIDEFIRLYNMTMDMHNAESMYYFDRKYYTDLKRNFPDNYIVFYAYMEDRTVASSLFLYDENYMHFHLGGRDVTAPNVPFENLLMVEAALWGSKQGLKKLHIGGGLSNEDSLFQYKKKFNRSGMLPFYIGRSIYDNEKYKNLIDLRTENDMCFDPNNNYFIQYRF